MRFLPALFCDGPIATIHLADPEHRNAIGPQASEALLTALHEVDRQPDLRVLIISSTGPAFCSGFDLSAYADVKEGDLAGRVEDLVGHFSGMMDALETVRVPTICSLQGAAIGGGADLVLACDLLLASPRAYLANPAAALGFHFYPDGMRRAISRLGLLAAKRLLLAGQRLEAGELNAMGCCTLVPEHDLPGTALSLARAMASQPPHVTQLMKVSLALGNRDERAGQIVENYRASLRGRDLWLGLDRWRRQQSARSQLV
jgi:enoyl-CoA hydratase